MRKIKRAVRFIKDGLTYVRVFSNKEEEVYFSVGRIEPEDVEGILSAKQLHAMTYLMKGFIDEDEVSNGIIHDMADPHQHHSTYFAVKRKDTLLAVARQIEFNGSGDHHSSFPVLNQAMIYSRSRMRLVSHHPTKIVEISALAKKRGESSIVPLIIYRAMWRHSIKEGHQFWVMACDVRLYDRLKLLFGPALTKIGQQTPYKGGDVIPVALHIPNSLKYLKFTVAHAKNGKYRLRTQAAKFILQGIERTS